MNKKARDEETLDKTEVMYRDDADVTHGHGPQLLGSSSLPGDEVYNPEGEELGDIKEIMLDMHSGRIGYVVLAFGGFLGMGEKFFAVPWDALRLDARNKRFVLDVERERLVNAPGFDKDHWPDMADASWEQAIHSYYGTRRTEIGQGL